MIHLKGLLGLYKLTFDEFLTPFAFSILIWNQKWACLKWQRKIGPKNAVQNFKPIFSDEQSLIHHKEKSRCTKVTEDEVEIVEGEASTSETFRCHYCQTQFLRPYLMFQVKQIHIWSSIPAKLLTLVNAKNVLKFMHKMDYSFLQK